MPKRKDIKMINLINTFFFFFLVGTIILLILMLPFYFIRKKKNPKYERNTIIRLVVLAFLTMTIFVLILGSGLIMMYFDDLRR